jgi:hypothetical protein
MKKQALLLLFFIIFAGTALYAQDTLPKFSVKSAGNNRTVIGWTNNFSTIKQISIQRSFDSLNNYKTILTVLDPTIPQNGYVDTKATNDHMFYRLYIMLDKGIYMFSDAKKPAMDSVKKIDPVTGDTMVTAKPFSVRLDKFPGGDSVAVPNPVSNKPKPNAYTPSLYVYTYRDGYVRINLPDDEKKKKYTIRFFDEEGTFLFELKEMKERDFKIDKSNFYHAGWFKFELYEDGKLMDKNKFYLEKDF